MKAFLFFICLSTAFQAFPKGKSVNDLIKFTPTSYEQLSGYIALLNDKTKQIKEVESDFKFNDSIDGIPGRGTSQIEDALYASLVFGEDKRAVMDGLYYFERCRLLNEAKRSSYAAGFAVLMNTAEKAFKVKGREIDEISIRAHFDHFKMNNEHGRQLAAAGYEEVIAIVARAYVLPSKSEKKALIGIAKEIATLSPVPIETTQAFSHMISVLVDNELQEKVYHIFQNGLIGKANIQNPPAKKNRHSGSIKPYTNWNVQYEKFQQECANEIKNKRLSADESKLFELMSIATGLYINTMAYNAMCEASNKDQNNPDKGKLDCGALLREFAESCEGNVHSCAYSLTKLCPKSGRKIDELLLEIRKFQ